jgi:hypothetical protein
LLITLATLNRPTVALSALANLFNPGATRTIVRNLYTRRSRIGSCSAPRLTEPNALLIQLISSISQYLFGSRATTFLLHTVTTIFHNNILLQYDNYASICCGLFMRCCACSSNVSLFTTRNATFPFEPLRAQARSFRPQTAHNGKAC